MNKFKFHGLLPEAMSFVMNSTAFYEMSLLN